MISRRGTTTKKRIMANNDSASQSDPHGLTQEQQFREAAYRRGLILPDVLSEGAIDRCPLDGRGYSNKDGAYLWSPSDSIASGGFQNHADGRGWDRWRADLGRPLTAKEEADFMARIRDEQAKVDVEQARAHADAAKVAAKIWEEAPPCETHPYLTKKGVQAYGLRVHGEELLIPASNAKGELTTFEKIRPDGTKRFLSGGKKKGSWFLIGTITDSCTIYLVEGYATGASVHEATGHPVVVAFDAGNMLAVAESIRAKYPQNALIICGDDDTWTENNPGKTKATEAAKAVGGQALFPDFGSDRVRGQKDFNDLHQAQGLEAVKLTLTPRRRLQPVRWSEMRHQFIEPVEYEIEEISPKVTFGVVAAQGGHGKSILTVQMAVGKAIGLPVLGFSTFRPGGVCIVALEDDLKVVHRRIAAAVRSYGADFTEEHHRLLDANLRVLVRPRNQYASMAPELLDMALTGLAGEIEEAMKTCEASPALCYLDTLNSVHEGDENDAKETRPLVAAILGLNARLGCSVWVVHHLRKIGNSSLKLVDRMDPELVRGSGAIVNSSRATLQFGWIISTEAMKAGLDPDRCTRRFAVVGITKLNDGEPGAWKLLQHTQNAGLWELVPNGSAILNGILQPKAKDHHAVTPADIVLVAFGKRRYSGEIDKAALAEKVYPESKDPKAALRQMITRLRKNGLIHPDRDDLTAAGKARVNGGTVAAHCDEDV